MISGLPNVFVWFHETTTAILVATTSQLPLFSHHILKIWMAVGLFNVHEAAATAPPLITTTYSACIHSSYFWHRPAFGHNTHFTGLKGRWGRYVQMEVTAIHPIIHTGGDQGYFILDDFPPFLNPNS